jgi:glycosyltransferase involved in cell wall biosynthesis
MTLSKKEKSQSWFTCAPVRFVGNDKYFSRDSGLLCKGFQELGISCKAIMPGPPMDDDYTDDLIRTDYKNLEDPDWWRSLGGEGVVFYGWGSGKYVKIAQAIKKSGLVLVSHMDTGGILGIFNGFSEISGAIWRTARGERSTLPGAVINYVVRLAYTATVGVIRNDWSRSKHLKEADVIGAISPIALERIRKVCKIYGGEKLSSKVELIPHPNASYMIPDQILAKEPLVVSVGRWDDAQIKGTQLLMATIGRFLISDMSSRVEIFGRATSEMSQWHLSLPDEIRQRVELKGIVPNYEVRQGLQRARVSLCTSLREGYHTVSAEALCCGCSIVGPDVPEIPSLKWFASSRFGRITERRPDAKALADEMTAWDQGERNAIAISNHWSSQLHAPRVAERIVALARGLSA